MIHTLNWNKISKNMLVSSLVLASVGTTFFQSISAKAQTNTELEISLAAVKPNGSQIIEIEAEGKEVIVEITKEQIAMVEKEVSKLSEAKQNSLETAAELATESLPQWMVSLTVVTGYLSYALRVWFSAMLGVCIANLWKCAMTAWAIVTGLNTADDMRRKIFG